MAAITTAAQKNQHNVFVPERTSSSTRRHIAEYLPTQLSIPGLIESIAGRYLAGGLCIMLLIRPGRKRPC